ncbi:hypothetical protein DFH07DRAFT_923958 [Mycena maculata]|uniref:NAD(P)-binding domain-containing protein n=1 Tax=Mycena maculata TaxID=230809 RepID=A0AAD7IQB3_9AGAR|nr:hypothetical protein DFH07DRAFT_923958 [Mycena maculata]
MASLKLNVLAVGASRNIGYFSAVRLLDKGATVTFLLRSPAVFDDDALIQGYIKSGHVRLVKGDATKEEDTRRAWNEAGVVDALIFSVGKYLRGTPSFSILKGIVIDQPNLCAQSILNVLCTMPTYADAPQPRIIVISSIGLTRTAHDALPHLIKPMYSMLNGPHRDKIGMERVLAHCAGWTWNSKADGEPGADIVGEGWRERPGLPAPGTLKRVLVIRPALLTDGKCVADKVAASGKEKKTYRVSEEELGGYTISRKDTAHFVVDALARWDEFENKRVNVAY